MRVKATTRTEPSSDGLPTMSAFAAAVLPDPDVHADHPIPFANAHHLQPSRAAPMRSASAGSTECHQRPWAFT